MARILDNDKVGNFKIIEKIGEGGMAVIYKAEQPALKRSVVIKKLKDPNREIIERFKKEAYVSASFSHENVLSIHDFIYIGRNYYLVMEYVDGKDLRTIIDYMAPVPPYIAALIIRGVAAGLEHTHSKGIIHRDIKPSNIIISRNGEVKLIDFGVAKDDTPSKLTLTGMIVGTPSYMSPEQANGDTFTIQTDIYSLGVLLYELVTGRKPFSGDTNTEIMMRIVRGKYPSPKKYNHDLQRRIVNIIKKCMLKDTDKRYHTASELIRDLNRFLPWQEQAGAKEILQQFVERFEERERTNTPSRLSSTALQSNSWKNWLTYTLLGVITLFSVYQLHRFLWNERLSSLAISINSSNTELYVDGTLHENAPSKPLIIAGLPPGRHLVKAVGLKNHGIACYSIFLVPGSKQSLQINLPKKVENSGLQVLSVPSAATVLVDGQVIGQTPLRNLHIEAGRHAIRVEKKGHQPVIDERRFEGGQNYLLHFELQSRSTSAN